MMDDVRKYMEAALEKLSPTKAREMARSAMQGQGKDQVTKYAQELLEWSQRNRDRVREIVRREVQSQLKSLGVASRDEIDALKKRVRNLERGASSAGRGSDRSGAKKTTPRGAAAKKAASKA